MNPITPSLQNSLYGRKISNTSHELKGNFNRNKNIADKVAFQGNKLKLDEDIFNLLKNKMNNLKISCKFVNVDGTTLTIIKKQELIKLRQKYIIHYTKDKLSKKGNRIGQTRLNCEIDSSGGIKKVEDLTWASNLMRKNGGKLNKQKSDAEIIMEKIEYFLKSTNKNHSEVVDNYMDAAH